MVPPPEHPPERDGVPASGAGRSGASASGYSNPEIPEGINTTDEHPLKEFAWLGTAVLVAVALLVMVFGWMGHLAGALVPFETERKWGVPVAEHFRARDPDPQVSAYLRDLADRLIAADPLPEGVSVTVHYDASSMVNAFATLGGNVVITRGLLQAMPHENALAMVLAHEIAHVRERHVIRALGRGVLTSIALAAIGGASGSDVAGGLIGQAGFTAGLTFSRSQERDADRIALRGVYALYGHVAGAETVFETLAQVHRHGPPEWLSTHPDSRKRIAAMADEASRHGWPREGALTALP